MWEVSPSETKSGLTRHREARALKASPTTYNKSRLCKSSRLLFSDKETKRMVAVARRRQIERYIETNVPDFKTNPEYREWESAGKNKIPKGRLPVTVKTYLKKIEREYNALRRYSYQRDSLLNSAQNYADEVARSEWNKENPVPERMISLSAKKQGLLHRVVAAQTEDELQSIMAHAEIVINESK